MEQNWKLLTTNFSSSCVSISSIIDIKRPSGLGDFKGTVTEDNIRGTNEDDTIYGLQWNDEIRCRQGMILNGSTAHHKLTTTYIDIVLSTSGSILLFILEFIPHFHEHSQAKLQQSLTVS